jgi:ABC-type branched-subunit amino acid transport system ATPase component
MSEQVKMSEGELLEVRTLQDKYQQNIFNMGQNTLRKLEAKEALKLTEDEEVKLAEEFKGLRKTEDEIIQKLLQKYGEGSLDLKAGTFISDKK